MGAISSIDSIPILKKYAQHENRDVRETCEIALGKIEWDHSEEGKKHQAETAEIASQSVSDSFTSTLC